MTESLIPDADGCPFCRIAAAFPPYPPTRPPPSTSTQILPDKVSPAAFIVLSTPVLIAFLDIAPLSRGHVLLCPRAHRHKLTNTSPTEVAESGKYLRLLSAAV